MFRVKISKRFNLFIGVVHHFDLADKPDVAQCPGIRNNSWFPAFVRLDDVSCIEHIQYIHIELSLYVVII